MRCVPVVFIFETGILIGQLIQGRICWESPARSTGWLPR